MARVIRAKHILYKGEKIGEVVVEEDTEKGELTVIFRPKPNPDSNSFGNNEAKFTYREKKEQSP